MEILDARNPEVTEGSLTSTNFDEDAAIRAVIDAAELKWDDHSSGQRGWRSMQWRRPGRSPAEGKTPPPPPGYVCRRCQVPGHFIQHCPTNGDPRFDFGRMGRAVAVVPTVSAGEVDGIPVEILPAAAAAAASVRVPDNFPPEQKVTADAALTNCCDKGIKDYTSSPLQSQGRPQPAPPKRHHHQVGGKRRQRAERHGEASELFSRQQQPRGSKGGHRPGTSCHSSGQGPCCHGPRRGPRHQEARIRWCREDAEPQICGGDGEGKEEEDDQEAGRGSGWCCVWLQRPVRPFRVLQPLLLWLLALGS